MEKEAELPKWFEGTVHEKGDVVKNHLSRQEIELNNKEFSMYIFIMSCQYLMIKNTDLIDLTDSLFKGLNWFKNSNPIAYSFIIKQLKARLE